MEDERMERDEKDVESVRKGKKRKRRKQEEEANIDPPTRWEVEYHIQKTKNYKGTGVDNIVAELIKHGGEALVDAVHKLIRTVWETEKMPEGWKLGIICSIYKKGDKLERGNSRGITLLSAAYKF